MNAEETGYDGKLVIGGMEVPITNATWDDEVQTNDVQHDTSLKPEYAVTGIRYSGSFDHDGSNPAVRNAARKSGGLYKGHPERLKIKIFEVDQKVIFMRAIIGTTSRDRPSDDSTSQSYEFVAEDMDVTGGGLGPRPYQETNYQSGR